MELLRLIFENTENLALICLFAIPAIGYTVYQSLLAYFRHRERIEMIQQGVHPDYMESDESEKMALHVKAG